MKKNALSRRAILKLSAALASMGVISWIPDKLEVKADDTDIGDSDGVGGIGIKEESTSSMQEQPFNPYFAYIVEPEEPNSIIITWGPNGEPIVTYTYD